MAIVRFIALQTFSHLESGWITNRKPPFHEIVACCSIVVIVESSLGFFRAISTLWTKSLFVVWEPLSIKV